MSTAQMTGLHDQILAILRKAGEPLSIPKIEFYLKKEDNWESDTFDVRDAVHQMIELGEAEYFHPGRLIRLLNP